jgi:predicted benzoate:H+ symporter BenE
VATVSALLSGIVATLVAIVLPQPSSVVGIAAFGGVAMLAVVVGHLIRALRDRDERLDRIERLIDERIELG